MHRRLRAALMLIFIVFLGVFIFLGCVLADEPTPLLPTNPSTPADVIIPPTATRVATTTSDAATSEPTALSATVTSALFATSTLSPTQTAQPTSTPTPMPTLTATSSPSPSPFPFALQPGTPAYIENFAYPDAGCDWAGIAGQIFAEDGDPIKNLVVLVSGNYGGDQIEVIGVTGTVAGDIYGPGGYEVKLGNIALLTQNAIKVQVFDLNGEPISDAVAIDTSDNCGQNLVIVNFNQ